MTIGIVVLVAYVTISAIVRATIKIRKARSNGRRSRS